MLVANDVGVRPPGGHVGVIGPRGAHDAGPPLGFRVGGVVPVVKVVHVLEAEAQGSLLAVDLDAVLVLVAGREARALVAGHCPALEAGQEEHRIIDIDLTLLGRALGPRGDAAGGTGLDDGPLLDEGLGDGPADLHDLVTGDEAGHVNDVGIEVAVGPAAGELLLEAPEQRGAWPAPVLQVDAAHVEDPPDLARGHQLMGQGHRRAAPIVVPHESRHLGLLGGLDHRPGIREGAGDGLLGGHRLAGGEGFHGRGHVHVIGRDDIDEVDLVVADHALPVGRGVLPAPALGEHFRLLALHPEDGVHHRVHRQVGEELADFQVGVRVGAAHEALADQGHVAGLGHRACLLCLAGCPLATGTATAVLPVPAGEHRYTRGAAR